MGTAKLLGLLFVRSIPTVVFVIILLAILDRLFFRPIAEVMKKRAEGTVGAMARAREQMNQAQAKTQEYESALRAAKMELYRQRQADHARVVEEHEAALRTARAHSEQLVKEAQAAIALEAAAAREQLRAGGHALAKEIADKILGGGAPA